MVSWRSVTSDGVTARIGTGGRKRAITRAVVPLLVQAMMATAPASTAARNAAADVASVIRLVGDACTQPSGLVGERGGRSRPRGRTRARPGLRWCSWCGRRPAGSSPMAVSAESISAEVPSNTALATSLTSARVGTGACTIDSSIWVAVMTGRP